MTTVDHAGTQDQYAVNAADIDAAMQRISGSVHHTPIMTSRRIDAIAGAAVHFKCENLQRIGAFKIRGASNAIAMLGADTARDTSAGVVTHSSGNHAQAIACAAADREMRATIVMPRDAPAIKRDAVVGYGGIIVECEPSQAAREAAADKIVRKTGAAFVHPSNDPNVIAGQGTIALEMLDDVPDLDTIVVPIGGGGMASGICIAARARNPKIRLIGAEPAACDDAAQSLAGGSLVFPPPRPNTIADGLKTGLGSNTWPIIRDHMDQIVTVDEAAIGNAMRAVYETLKLVIEPSAAVGVAAILDRAAFARTDDEQIGVVLCGGNVDLDRLPWINGPPMIRTRLDATLSVTVAGSINSYGSPQEYHANQNAIGAATAAPLASITSTEGGRSRKRNVRSRPSMVRVN